MRSPILTVERELVVEVYGVRIARLPFREQDANLLVIQKPGAIRVGVSTPDQIVHGAADPFRVEGDGPEIPGVLSVDFGHVADPMDDAETVYPTFPRWILVGRCCTLPMTNVQPLDRSIKDFPAPASIPSRLGTSNLLPTRSTAQTFLSGIPDKSHCAAASTASPRCRCKWTGPKPCDTPQNLPEQLAWDRHFGHLERHVLRVLCHLGTDLHQLLPQCCERPVLHATGQRQTAQEIGQVVGQGEQLQANLVVGKAAAGKPSPLERVLALLDPLFGRAPAIVGSYWQNGAGANRGMDRRRCGLAGRSLG